MLVRLSPRFTTGPRQSESRLFPPPIQWSVILLLPFFLFLIVAAVANGGGEDGLAHDAAASHEVQLPWGDVYCDESVNAIDALRLLRHIANFPHYPECGDVLGPQPDGTVEIDGVQRMWADIDCDNEIDAVDALWILRSIVGLPVHQTEGCPSIGTLVNV
jgi:hypothetical protein